MKNIRIISALALMVLFISSCELIDGETYNNAYAQEWYKTTEIGTTESWDVVKLNLSDQSFEVTEATLDNDANISEYTGKSKGSITETDSYSLMMTVEESSINGTWYTRDGYIEYLVNAEISEFQAEIEADEIFITTAVTYLISNDPATLTIGGANDFSGTYYASVMASVINE